MLKVFVLTFSHHLHWAPIVCNLDYFVMQVKKNYEFVRYTHSIMIDK